LSETSSTATIVVESLVARAGRTALARLSLSWTAGAHAVLGAREDGGPLLLATIAGRVLPRSGQVRIFGADSRHPRVRRQVAYVPLETSLPDALRVDEALSVAAALRAEPAQDAGGRLAVLGLEALARRPVRSLLASEARAVALAEALTSTQVRVLFIEEPFAVMDARAAGRMAERLRARAEGGAVIVVATASVGDATAMPFPDNSFDIVIAAEVMEHIPADQAAIGEVARVLRPGGIAAVTVPAWLPERICWLLSDDYHNVPGGHIRIFTRHELETKLARAGLDVGGHHHAHALHSPYWWLKCAVGVHADNHPLASAYHKLLVWDIMRKPAVTQLADRALNPLIGKSLVVYATKPAAVAVHPRPAAAEKVHAAA